MRKVSADILFPVSSPPLENGVLVLNGETIEDVLPPSAISDWSDVERYSGILCPGFVNTHCHIELSHLHGKIPTHTGLPDFVQHVQHVRKATAETVLEAMYVAEQSMLANGIVAVGDISNSELSLPLKSHRRLYYHTFVEVFGFDPAKADEIVERANALSKRFTHETGMPASLTLHAPYSVSHKLIERVSEQSSRISLHNQETAAEDEMFLQGKGKMADMLRSFGLPLDNWQVPGTSSLMYMLEKLPAHIPLLLVHNTFTSMQDMRAALSRHTNLFWCCCPSANTYIEKALPDIYAWQEAGARITLGTDSLASNTSLSIWQEMQLLKENFPELPWEEIVTWASLNGAEFLGISDVYGSFEKGKRPGVNCLKPGSKSVQKIV